MEKTDITRGDVENFYGAAAVKPKNDLCCPTSYPKEDTSHIPDEVLERFYGCGSPVSIAGILEGETVVDLGSGAGIDCFIASKIVGPGGNVIGIDMTDKMLEVANRCKSAVEKNLGYKNVNFRKGFLEKIPVDDSTADLITSNCVINLSTDKLSVFREIFRTLKDHGRIVISDVVSEVELPTGIRENKKLWGECIGGCITENQLVTYLEQAGFYGVQLLDKTYWKEVENINFYSVTVKAHKLSGSGNCIFKGQKAVYMGPFKVVIDDEGHVYPRNENVEICSDTASRLSNPPYRDHFRIYSNGVTEENDCCADNPENQIKNGSCC